MITTRSEFLKQLDELDIYIDRLTDKTVADVRALGLGLSGDAGACAGVLKGSKTERRLRSAIEENCLDIMLLQQPVADDLRFVTGTFRIVSDLTHIDEMARDVAFLLENLPAKVVKRLDKQLALADEKVAIMIEEAVGAFRTCDRERAEKIFAMDDEVDVIYAEAEQAIIDMIRNGKTSPKYLPELLMVAKYFERMADDAERIADWAVFRVTGKHEVHSQENYIEMEAARAQLANDAESGASEE